MDAKKISFGFSKITKKPNLLPVKQLKGDNKVELIKCLEGQEIKLVVEKSVEPPLVIPMQINQKTSAAIASLIKRRAVLFGEDDVGIVEGEVASKTTEEIAATENCEDIEKRAERELLAELQKNNENLEPSTLVLPVKADELPLDGAKESSIDDYESIPIQQFGLAMLRGMGWKEPAKKKGAPPVEEAPFVRPKGMGLGADKALKPKPLLVQPAANEVLEIKRQAYVRILGGKHKDLYGQIEGFDDHAGRVIVKMAIGGTKEAFNEFLCQAVTKKEFTEYGKCINTAKYEEYKKMENEYGQIVVKREKIENRSNDGLKVAKIKQEINYKDDRYENRRENDSDEKSCKIVDHKTDIKGKQESKYEKRRYESRGRNDIDSKAYKDEPKELSTGYDDRVAKSRNGELYERRRNDNEPHSTSRYRDYDTSTSTREHKHYAEQREKRRSRTPTRHTSQQEQYSHSSSSRNCRRQSTTEDDGNDTSETSGSDADSAYERKYKHRKSSVKSKKSKTKKSKSKSSRRKDNSSREDDSDCYTDDDERRSKKHKKKTKKSKKARSRSRSPQRKM